MLIIISIAAFVATLLGGLFALKLKDKLHLILGFSAGAVIAVAFFDLIPESISLGQKYFSNDIILSVTALGFLTYLVLDRIIFLHGHSHEEINSDVESHADHHERRSILGAGSLCLHSFLDGIAIGLAFKVSPAIGIIVAVAVLAHDFSDGINTVSVILRSSNNAGGLNAKSKTAFSWLVADAIAPVLGVITTIFFSISEKSLALTLAVFAGFFLYIGASDLIPESQHAHPKILTTLMTLVGAGVLYIAIRFAGL